MGSALLGCPDTMCDVCGFGCFVAERSQETCAELGWGGDFGVAAVCGASEIPDATGTPSCSGPVDHVAAEAICEAVGARLCTGDELLGNEARATGCGYDSGRVWSSTPCSDGGYLTGAGSSDFAAALPALCLPPTAVANVRCCADVDTGREAGLCGAEASCFDTCTPKTCSTLESCGVVDDGCGSLLTCPEARLGICGRGAAGIWCAGFTPTGGIEDASLWTGAFNDADGYAPAIFSSTVRFPDVNGDGYADVCARASAGLTCHLGDGNSFSAGTWQTDLFSDVNGWGNLAWAATLQFADLNNDGRDDVCGRAESGVWCSLSLGNTFGPGSLWTGALSDANGFGEVRYWSNLQLVDLDGDGRADVCSSAPGQSADFYQTHRCARSDGTQFVGFGPSGTDIFKSPSGLPHLYGSIHYPDLNNDGAADACAITGDPNLVPSGGVSCAVSRKSWASLPLYRGYGAINDQYLYYQAWEQAQYWGTVHFPDLNGDGNADICARGSAGLECALNTGTEIVGSAGGGTEIYVTFGATSRWSSYFTDSAGWGQASRWSTFAYQDINGDGNEDVCARGPAGVVCGTSDGTGSFTNVGVVNAFMADIAGWDSDQSYWGTIALVPLIKGCAKVTRNGLPWGSSGVPPRQP